MNKKILVILVILCVFAAVQVHSLGIGAQLNYYTGEMFAPGLSIVLSPTERAHLALNWFIDFEETNIVGLTFDVCPVKASLTPFNAGPVFFTLGLGLYSNVVITDEIGFTGGLRIPLGFSLFLARTFELYTHVAPSFGVNMLPSIDFSKPFYPVALGARLWF